MKGSEKQIVWASEIRDYMINGVISCGTIVKEGTTQLIVKYNKMLESEIEDLEDETNPDDIKVTEKLIIDYTQKIKNLEYLHNLLISNDVESSFIIDNRGMGVSILILAEKLNK